MGGAFLSRDGIHWDRLSPTHPIGPVRAIAIRAHGVEGRGLECFTLADGTLRVGDDARAIARSVLEAPTGPGGETAGLLTAGLLPQPLRADFGLPWDESREQALQELEVRVRAARRAAGTPVDAGREAR
jgi:hypothetical protein